MPNYRTSTVDSPEIVRKIVTVPKNRGKDIYKRSEYCDTSPHFQVFPNNIH